MSKKVNITLEVIVSLEYDEELKEFKQSLSDYKDSIDSSANEKSMLKQIAFYLTNNFDVTRLIEGVGKVGKEDWYKPEDLYCGVNLLDTDINVISFNED